MKVEIFERKADGGPDEYWHGDLGFPKRYSEQGALGDASLASRKTTLLEQGGTRTELVTDAVVFSCPAPYGVPGTMTLFWIPQVGRWVGISSYEIQENSSGSQPWSECHGGPYEVDDRLGRKIVEAFAREVFPAISDPARLSPEALRGREPLRHVLRRGGSPD